jgi:hypothetical protein
VRVWRKSGNEMSLQAEASLHQGSLSFMSLDRGALFTIGHDDGNVGVWNAVDLSCLSRVESISAGIQSHLGTTGSLDVTACFRPSARWVKAPQRGAIRPPPGLVYIAGLWRAEDASSPVAVLSKWSFAGADREAPECTAAQVTGSEPITALVYGPYDNGPLVTGDQHGFCQVWEWGSRLIKKQDQIKHEHAAMDSPGWLLIVEPRKGLLSVGGDRGLCAWRLCERSGP